MIFGFFGGAFDKYVEIPCYFLELFKRFGCIWKIFGAFLTNFENSKEVLGYFLCNFLKTPEFGRTPKVGELATALSLTKFVPYIVYCIH